MPGGGGIIKTSTARHDVEIWAGDACLRRWGRRYARTGGWRRTRSHTPMTKLESEVNTLTKQHNSNSFVYSVQHNRGTAHYALGALNVEALKISLSLSLGSGPGAQSGCSPYPYMRGCRRL